MIVIIHIIQIIHERIGRGGGFIVEAVSPLRRPLWAIWRADTGLNSGGYKNDNEAEGLPNSLQGRGPMYRIPEIRPRCSQYDTHRGPQRRPSGWGRSRVLF